MGKTTLYHPVSLHVIRGAAQWMGWEFGKIEQLSAEPEMTRAVYRAEITAFPVDPDETTLNELTRLLKQAFMRDILPISIRKLPGEKWMCNIIVDLSEAKQQPVPSLTVEQWRAMREGADQ